MFKFMCRQKFRMKFRMYACLKSKGKYSRIVFVLLGTLMILNISFNSLINDHNFMPEAPAEIGVPPFDRYVTQYRESYWKNTTVKTILIWTPFFNDWGWLENAKEALPLCSKSCTVTANRQELKTSDAVLFHASDLWTRMGLPATISNPSIEMPRTRTPNQVWVLWTMEPMAYMWGNVKPNTFNWTVLYRRDSTIYMPFGHFFKTTKTEHKNSLTKLPNFAKNKTKFAVTLVSNCLDQARRYRIIRELKKHIDLDDFGACSGRIICPAGVPTFECGERYLKPYKFYIAFENSFCRDYISEKFWNALHRRQIPVIAAPKVNLELVPPNSYLNVFDFPSIKHLAEKMIEINENDTLFNSYFEWTKHYRRDTVSSYCKLCSELHANRTAQSYHDMEGWMRDDSCQKSSAISLVSGFFDRLLFDLGLN